MNRGLGGPYIPNPRGVQPEQLSAEKLEALSRMVKSLPVAAPLHSYEIGSRFGVRGDPMNAHLALHTGTDFRAPYDLPVYATAAGTVTFSGYRADYGKIVEIDHGNGLATRYGHLNRATVSVGQRVAAQTQIGFLGSTGRATGPHVHYEVVVNGEPQDPEKFMGSDGSSRSSPSGSQRHGNSPAAVTPLSTACRGVRRVGNMEGWRNPRHGWKYRALYGVAIRKATRCRWSWILPIAAPFTPRNSPIGVRCRCCAGPRTLMSTSYTMSPRLTVRH